MNICKEHDYEKLLSSLKNIEQSSHIDLYHKYKNPLIFENLESLILNFIKDETYMLDYINLYKFQYKIWVKVGTKMDYNKFRVFRFKTEKDALSELYDTSVLKYINAYLENKVKIYKRNFNIDKLLEI